MTISSGRLLSGAASLAVVVMPASALAQAIEAANVPTGERSDIIVQGSKASDGYKVSSSYVATGIPADIMDTARSVNTASQQLIQDRGITDLEQAIQTLPGVNRDNSFGGTQDSFNIRGFRVYSSTASTNPGILIDGVRGAMARGFQANTDRVELLSGPSAMLYGRTEPGGVINIVRKQPLYTAYHALEGDAGSYEHYRFVADSSGPIAPLAGGETAYRLVVSGERQDSWRKPGHAAHDWLIAPSLGWKNDKVQLVLAYEFNESTSPLDRGTVLVNGRPAAIPRDLSYGEAFARSHNRSHFLRGNVDYAVNGWLTLRTRAAYMDYLSDDMQVNALSLSANGDMVRYVMGNKGDHQKNIYAQQSAVATFHTGALSHQLLVGADYRDQDRVQQGQVISGALTGFNILTPVYGTISEASATLQPVNGPFFVNHDKEWGVFAQDSVTIGRLIVTGGLRWSRITLFGTQQGTVTDNSRPSVVLPSASLLYKVTDAFSLYGSYSKSFHPNASVPANPPFTIGSGPFSPEKGTGWEAGAKANLLGGKLLATAAAFRIDKQNVLVTTNNVTQTVGSVRSQGFELTTSGQITPAFNITASYTFTDATVRNDPRLSGKNFVNVPKDKGSVFGTYEVKQGGLKGVALGAGATASSRIAVDTANSAFLPGYLTMDAMLRFRARTPGGLIYRLQINASNLLDRTYYPYSAGNLRIGVGDPRKIMGTAKIEF